MVAYPFFNTDTAYYLLCMDSDCYIESLKCEQAMITMVALENGWIPGIGSFHNSATTLLHKMYTFYPCPPSLGSTNIESTAA